MDEDYRGLASALFAAMTAMLEDAAEAAAAGQSLCVAPVELAARVRQIQAAAQDVATVAEAALVITRIDPENR